MTCPQRHSNVISAPTIGQRRARQPARNSGTCSARVFALPSRTRIPGNVLRGLRGGVPATHGKERTASGKERRALKWCAGIGFDPAGTQTKAAASASLWPCAVKTPNNRPHRKSSVKGRGRYDLYNSHDKPKKDICLCPLINDWKRTLDKLTLHHTRLFT